MATHESTTTISTKGKTLHSQAEEIVLNLLQNKGLKITSLVMQQKLMQREFCVSLLSVLLPKARRSRPSIPLDNMGEEI